MRSHESSIDRFAASPVDGRLFPQAAALARNPYRPVVLLEGPAAPSPPNIHANALTGAIASLAVMWRLPVLHAADPEDALRIMRLLGDQARKAGGQVLRRYDRKPKRTGSRKLHLLQGLPGVGPALAQRLLVRFGSIERVVTAPQDTLTEVQGLGSKKAARIREVVG